MTKEKDKYTVDHFWKDPKKKKEEEDKAEPKAEKKKSKLKLDIPSGKRKR